jgi:hypothetical protein
MLRHANFYIKGGKRPFAAFCTEVFSAGQGYRSTFFSKVCFRPKTLFTLNAHPAQSCRFRMCFPDSHSTTYQTLGDAPSANAVFLVDGKTIKDCSRCHPKFRHRPSLIDAEKTAFSNSRKWLTPNEANCGFCSPSIDQKLTAC